MSCMIMTMFEKVLIFSDIKQINILLNLFHVTQPPPCFNLYVLF